MLNLQTKKINFEAFRWPLIYTTDSDSEYIMSPFYHVDSCQISEKWIKMSIRATRINKSAVSYDASTFSNTGWMK